MKNKFFQSDSPGYILIAAKSYNLAQQLFKETLLKFGYNEDFNLKEIDRDQAIVEYCEILVQDFTDGFNSKLALETINSKEPIILAINGTFI
ncbi:hypothetical protein BK128_21360 [Viridibacillus sp. FSL H7-0596]|uniref:hypothetical protein n=1 Tax=Viridibacillus sp. FSL H7-0596 TaxID=1928923 RepID=UPI00096E7C04|nr:hypothetical protein [Viridibacillus sp. FSL H7-0596]OMC81821.1 hypothetical protein BK128_21360 [Viridibacillus sp. FSL H7-0596]